MTPRLFALLFTLALLAQAQAPAVSPGGILNHFSFATPGLPNGSLAQGSIFDIYGTNIGPAELAQPGGFPLPTQLAGTSVQVTVAGTTTEALLFFVARNQIAALLPSRTPEGTGTLTVTVNGVRSAASPLTVVARSLGILTLAQTGRGAAVMQLTGANGEVFLNSVTRSASAGQVGVFYGTGLGRVPFDESRAAPVQNLDPPIQAFVAGAAARVLFQGRTPGLAGLDQINLEIPAGVSGCYLPVWFQTGTVISNVTTISVAASLGSACPDPLPPPPAASTGTLKTGTVNLVRTSILVRFPPPVGLIELVTDTGTAAFSSIDLSKLPPPGPASPLVQIGNCIVGPLQQQTNTGDGGAGAVSYLDAGPVITIRGPGGVRPLSRQATGHFAILGTTPVPGVPAQQGPPYLVPGVYTADNGGGGTDVPAFTASVTLPGEFTWTNASPNLSLTRADGFEFTWNGGDSTGWVDIAGTSTLPRVAGQSTGGGYFSCRVRASAGRLRIGPEILLHLPPSFAMAGGDQSGVISVSNTFTATPLPLSGFTPGELNVVFSVTRPAQFR